MTDFTDSPVNVAVASGMSDIVEESRFATLNELGFVRAETPEDQWRLLVNSAWEKSGCPVNETIAIYLSKMLNFYMYDVELFERLAAFNYAAHLLKAETVEEECLKDIADVSLQYVAFVPGRHNHRLEPRSLPYSSRLGESFYQHLAEINEKNNSFFAQAYRELAKSFGIAVMVLRSVNVPFDHIDISSNGRYFADDTMAQEVAAMKLLTAKTSGAAH